MNASPKPRLKVIGVGNEWRGDDAVGLLVARRLKAEQLPQVQIVEMPGHGDRCGRPGKTPPG